MSEWRGYVIEDYEFNFEPGSLVLDVGCGQGRQMEELMRKGCRAVGIDVDTEALSTCREKGLSVVFAEAERMPFADSSFDGIVCKVVLPLTVEDQAIGEFGRVIKPGGQCYLICHGAGFYLKCLLLPPYWKHRIYALRTLFNTWLWTLTGKSLPGFLGDTLYQSRRRLAKYYRAHGYSLTCETTARGFLGFPVFIYHRLKKKNV